MTSEGSILPEENEINFIFHLLVMISFINLFILWHLSCSLAKEFLVFPLPLFLSALP